MRSFYEKIVCNLTCGGITKREYMEIENEIYEKNRKSLRMVSLCLVLMFTGLMAATFISETMAPNRPAYSLTGLCFLVIWLVCGLLKQKGRRFIIPLWYAAMSVMFGYAIVLNTVIRNDISGTTFCLILLAAPMLIIDRPWRVFVYFCVIIAVFIPIDLHQKSYYLAFTDTVNALCSVFVGSVIHMSIMRTKLREMMQRRYIEKQRDTDHLTGCLTKAAFEQRVKETMCIGEHYGAFIIMDIDHFKSVNDNYGHVYGDMVLHNMGKILCQCFGEESICGRFGGDEFQIWLGGRKNRSEIEFTLNKVVSQLHLIKHPDGSGFVTASMGVAICPEYGEDYHKLFMHADDALYTAKKEGRDCYVFCS
ncbi:MAG: GGDEF domain-containing protein [Firmicutes bacterium]|nr:GGDEF domain-containing protein [Bacillota bacterium]